MLTRLFASRGFLSFGLIVLLGLAAALGYRLLQPSPQMRAYCAQMPDAIGLFEGSDVTVMGVPIGRITKIEPNGATARVAFEIRADRTLPAEVGATTLADSLIADRKLALIGNEPTGPGWNPATCITKTATPKSLSETFSALARLAEELNGVIEPGQSGTIEHGLASLDTMSAGTGDQINSIISRLGTALDSPDAAIGHLGALMDAMSSLARSAATYWPEIKDMATRLPQLLDNINNIALPPLLTTLQKMSDVLPVLNELTVMFGGPLLRRLDAVENLPQQIRAGIEGLRGIIEMTPALSGAFSDAIDPQTRAVSLAYAPPRVAIPQQDSDQVCAAVNLLAPGRCTASDGMVNLQLAQVILGSVGAR